jgi:hypothetical protein
VRSLDGMPSPRDLAAACVKKMAGHQEAAEAVEAVEAAGWEQPFLRVGVQREGSLLTGCYCRSEASSRASLYQAAALDHAQHWAHFQSHATHKN